MLSLDLLEDRKSLKKEILKHLDFVLYNCNFNSPNIKIYTNGGNKKDYPRMFFILFVLSRVAKAGLLSKELTDKVVKLENSLYHDAKNTNIGQEMLYVQVYSMRFRKNFDLDIGVPLQDLSQMEQSLIFSSPVLVYQIISAFIENSQIVSLYPYSVSIFGNALKTFEYLLFSSEKDRSRSYFFSESCYWKSVLTENAVKESEKVIQELALSEINSRNIASSAIAKSLEYFTFVDDKNMISKIFTFINSRSINNYSGFSSPVLRQFEVVFTENDLSQFVTLDTTGHIIISLLNIYERKN